MSGRSARRARREGVGAETRCGPGRPPAGQRGPVGAEAAPHRAGRGLLLAAAAFGLAVSLYLTGVHYAGAGPVCPTGGCEAVQSSRYAELLGLPVALLGAVAWSALLLASALRGRRAAAAGTLVALSGAVFSLYLVAAQAALVEAWCSWCLVSDGLMLLAAALAVRRFLGEP